MWVNKNRVERTNLESPLRRQNPTKRVHNSQANDVRIEEGHERINHLQFPILDCSYEINIPSISSALKTTK
ncbi:hypothetical protein FCV25MIE_15596, partial [Fagus crenata]